jgi:hypothetical protein
MIVINLFHIKTTNGLYYYSLDYTRENFNLVRSVLVRPNLASRVTEDMPGLNVIPCSPLRFLSEAIRIFWSGDLLYTPTSHPLPLLDRQWIVLHDSYPFEVGPKSKIKRFLFKGSLAMSRCRVAYINRSEAQPFVASLGVDASRMVFAPNRFPEASSLVSPVSSPNEMTTVGLFGTDSAKKNYDRLFSAVRAAELSSRLIFRVYGHDTAYFRDIQGQFPDIQIELVRSDDMSIDAFMCGVDVLASASEQEGFGRPFASALLAGFPVELLDRPVFREFFTGGARFHPNIDALVQSLPRLPGIHMSKISFTAPVEVLEAYARANDEIRRLGSIALR